MRTTIRTAVLGTVLIFCAALKSQTTWAEVGDAGELVGSAQAVNNVGQSLTTITGALSFNYDRDFYRIWVEDFSQFSATTQGSAVYTWLYLLDIDGYPIAFHDRDSALSCSVLPVGHPAYASLPPGVYHIGVSSFLSYAHGATGRLFYQDWPSTEVQFPQHTLNPYVAQAPLSHWNSHPGAPGTGQYQIHLTGCAPSPLIVSNVSFIGPGSFSEALAAASPTAPGHSIYFRLFSWSSQLSHQLTTPIVINKPVRLIAPSLPNGDTYIEFHGAAVHRLFEIGGPQPITVTMQGIRLNLGAGAPHGGGILVTQPGVTLNLKDCEVTGCVASGGDGGGIYSAQAGTTINLTRTLVSGCSATRGGGMLAGEGVTVNLTDCEFSGNTSTTTGPGALQVFSEGGATHSFLRCTFAANTGASGAGAVSVLNLTASGTASANFVQCTFSGNTTAGAGAGALTLGAVMASAGVEADLTNCTFSGNAGGTASTVSFITGSATASAGVTYRNSIFAGASPCFGGTGPGVHVSASDDNNICTDNSANLTEPNDQSSTDPLLQALADNGGFARTHLPQLNSPAIDRGRGITGITADQRGFARPLDDFNAVNGANSDGSDIGSVESYPPAPTLSLASPSTFTIADDYYLEHSNGETLADASLEIDDATGTDDVELTVTFESGPMGSMPPIGISAPASQTITAASLPFAISWTGTVSSLNASGVYTWRLDLDDQTRVTTFHVQIRVENEVPTFTAAAGVETSAGSFGPLFSARLLTGAMAVVDMFESADANLGDTLTASVVSKLSNPQNSTLQFAIGFSAPGNPATFTIEPLSVSGPGDRGSHLWQIRISDGSVTLDAYVNLFISDFYAPTITSPPAPANAADGLPYAHQFTADANPAATYSVVSGALPAWATLTPQGLLSGTAVLGQDGTFTVRASNGVNPPADEVITITVTTAVAPTITSGTPTSSVDAAAPYLFQFAADGNPTVTWSMSGHPVWLHLHPASGLLTGAPHALHAGTTGPITVTATNALGTDDITFTITVNVAAPVITSALPPTTANPGQLYSFTFTATGTPAVGWSISDAPPWLTLDTVTGELSGTPGTADLGLHGPITVTAYNDVAPIDSVTWTITVQSGGGDGGGDGDGGSDTCTTTGRPGGLMLLSVLVGLALLAVRASRRSCIAD